MANSTSGDPARCGVRKAQYHWGWDWGPILMTAGIWRDVRLEVYRARIQDLHVHTSLSPDHETAVITVFADVDSTNPASHNASHVRLSLHLNDDEVAREDMSVMKDGVKAAFHLNMPSLWWPSGYGKQTLYVATALLMMGEHEIHRVSKKVGIRTAEVIQQDDKHGKSFFFRINGVDIFCGGSCWIPADSLLSNIRPERYRRWVELMAAGNQVMVRCVMPLFALACVRMAH